MDLLSSIWTLIVTIMSDIGELWRWATICLIFSVVVTQSLKSNLDNLTALQKKDGIRLLAFNLAFVPMIIREPNGEGFMAAVLVGVLSPLLYKVLAYVVCRKWPLLAKALSSDDPEYGIADFIRDKKD